MLQSVTLPDSVVWLGPSVFYDCSKLRSIRIPAGVTELQRYAFFGCSALEEMAMHEGIVAIRRGVFGLCSRLQRLIYPGTEEQWDSIIIEEGNENLLKLAPAFGTMGSNYTYSIAGIQVETRWIKTLYILGSGPMDDFAPDELPFAGERENITTIILPEGLTHLGANALKDCSRAITIVVPESCTSFGEGCFDNCRIADLTVKCGSPALEYVTDHGMKYTIVQHKGLVTEPGFPATCETDGRTEGEHCETCGTVIREAYTIPATGHKLVILPAVEATCEESGLTQGEHCSNCKKVTIEQHLIPATGHTEVVDPGRKAACEQTGLTEGKHCSACGKITQKQEIIPAGRHEEETDPDKAPACEEPGRTQGVHCSICQKVLVAPQELPPTGHHLEGVVCKLCGTILDAAEMKTLRLPEKTSVVESEAFAGAAVEAVRIPEGCRRIEEMALASCPLLHYIFLPEHCRTEISQYAFWDCGKLVYVYY